MHRLLLCFMMDVCDEPAPNEPERLVKTTKKLAQRHGHEAHEFYHCAWNEMRRLPLEFQKAANRTRIFTAPLSSYCLDREQICENHKHFVYPIVCMLEERCDRRLAKLLYAFLYGIDQLNAESEKPLGCGGSELFDVDRSSIFRTDFCSDVPPIEVTAAFWQDNELDF
ncbi:hypothetical protein M3Y99_01890000 [Aphelenchoides fujianensis]|nr:hypothetical protein M3Y99_01890000 [Aphelenchoides fujianensis]